MGIDSCTLQPRGRPAIRSTTFHYGGEAVKVDIKPEHGVDSLLAPRRTVLDPLLVDAARQAGAVVRHGVALSELQFASSGRIIGVSLRDGSGASMTVGSDIVIGADGRQSTVAQLVNAQVGRGLQCLGHRIWLLCRSKWRRSALAFRKKRRGRSDPTNSGHCIFAAVPASQFVSTFRGDAMGGFLQVLASNSPELRANVEGAALICRLRSFGGAKSDLRNCHGAGWALVGDAGYFKDPLTAHGITDALRDAQLLSRGIVEGGARGLEAYQRERDALSLPLMRTTDAIASFSWDFDEVKQLHADLSAAMKTEANHIASSCQPASLAA